MRTTEDTREKMYVWTDAMHEVCMYVMGAVRDFWDHPDSWELFEEYGEALQEDILPKLVKLSIAMSGRALVLRDRLSQMPADTVEIQGIHYRVEPMGKAPDDDDDPPPEGGIPAPRDPDDGPPPPPHRHDEPGSPIADEKRGKYWPRKRENPQTWGGTMDNNTEGE